MNDSNDLNMNFYSCPLSFNEHICLAQHSIRQGRCVIFFGSVQQTWLCPPDISSTTVAIPARHPPSDIAPPDTRLPPYFHWAPSRPAAATSTSRWAHYTLARNLALREVSIMRHDNPHEASLVRVETPDHRVMLKALG